MPVLFVALRLPPPLRDALEEVMDGVPGARWQSEEQLHLTLRYLGPVSPRQAEDVCDALAGVRAPPLRFAAAGVGAFGTNGRANALWAGVAPVAPLAALHRKIDHALVSAGLPPEGRAYLPHMTLARMRRGGVDPAAVAAWRLRHAAFATAPVTVVTAMLLESVATPAGSVYFTPFRWNLCDEARQGG